VEISVQTLLLLPILLGLLGFVEPCTLGGHILFLGTLESRTRTDRLIAVLIFTATRAFVAGLFGALITFAGQRIIGLQTGVWLIFGVIYFSLGMAYLFGGAQILKKRVDLPPEIWKRAGSPAILGMAFGLNIPACAAPILFGLLGLAATSGTILIGFLMMSLFGLSMSLPLIAITAIPKLASWLDILGHRLKSTRWFFGLLFVLFGLWSIWFGLFVDPENWADT
jgi:cytochrome c-type biogenesis protein